MKYVEELTRLKIENDLKHYYDLNRFMNLNDNELNSFFTDHISKNKQEIKMKDFYELKDKNILIESLDGFVRVGKKIKKEQLECYTLTLVDGRKLSGAFNHLVETDEGWVGLKQLAYKHNVLTTDGFIKVKNIRQIKTQDVYDLECLHINHRYLSNGISNHNTGKSFAAMMIIKHLMDNKHTKFDIITNSKILQTQYFEDFEFMNNLWGSNNYSCNKYECSCETGKDLAQLNGIKCEDCPYDEAKEWYFGGQVGLTNYHMFILYNIFLPHVYEAREAKVLIVDECLHPDSLITMSDDSIKKIKDLETGELVKTYNDIKNIMEDKPIEKIHHNLNKGQQMYELEMENGTILNITGNHKVYLSNKTWVKVEDLKGNEDILNYE